MVSGSQGRCPETGRVRVYICTCIRNARPDDDCRRLGASVLIRLGLFIGRANRSAAVAVKPIYGVLLLGEDGIYTAVVGELENEMLRGGLYDGGWYAHDVLFMGLRGKVG